MSSNKNRVCVHWTCKILYKIATHPIKKPSEKNKHLFFISLVHLNERTNLKRDRNKQKVYRNTLICGERKRLSFNYIQNYRIEFRTKKNFFFVTCRFGRFILKIVSTQYINKKKSTPFETTRSHTYSRSRVTRNIADTLIDTYHKFKPEYTKIWRKKQQQPLTTNFKKNSNNNKR